MATERGPLLLLFPTPAFTGTAGRRRLCAPARHARTGDLARFDCGPTVNLAQTGGRTVVYCYPQTLRLRFGFRRFSFTKTRMGRKSALGLDLEKVCKGSLYQVFRDLRHWPGFDERNPYTASRYPRSLSLICTSSARDFAT